MGVANGTTPDTTHAVQNDGLLTLEASIRKIDGKCSKDMIAGLGCLLQCFNTHGTAGKHAKSWLASSSASPRDYSPVLQGSSLPSICKKGASSFTLRVAIHEIDSITHDAIIISWLAPIMHLICFTSKQPRARFMRTTGESNFQPPMCAKAAAGW
eukprot:618546-Pelagomonas_calceolata.AAC.1